MAAVNVRTKEDWDFDLLQKKLSQLWLWNLKWQPSPFTIIDLMSKCPLWSIGPKYVWFEVGHNRVTYLTTSRPTNGLLLLSLLDPYCPSIKLTKMKSIDCKTWTSVATKHSQCPYITQEVWADQCESSTERVLHHGPRAWSRFQYKHDPFVCTQNDVKVRGATKYLTFHLNFHLW